MKTKIKFFLALFVFFVFLSVSSIIYAQENSSSFYDQIKDEQLKSETQSFLENSANDKSETAQQKKQELIQKLRDDGFFERQFGNLQEGTACFDYYKFQSVTVSFGLPENSYSAGDKIAFKGEINNENSYPIIDGNLFVRISHKNDNYLTDGNFIVDEFIAQQNIILEKNSINDISFDWQAPSSLAEGDYRADFFFSVGKKFNLGGLPFTNEVVAGGTEFKITSVNKSSLLLSRNETKVNGENYQQVGNWPTIEKDQQVSIIQPLANTHAQAKNVKIKYELYFWDSLSAKDKLSEKEELITIPANSSVALNYSIDKMQDAVYYLKIIAVNQDDETEKSIINIRFVSEQEHARLNYPAINKFPLQKGDSYTLFSCFHNTSSVNTTGKVVLTLTDKQNQKVAEKIYEGVIPSEMWADKGDFKADKQYDYLKLNAELYDANNQLVDNYEAVYDCAKLKTCFQETILFDGVKDFTSVAFDEINPMFLVFLLIILGAIAAVLWKVKKRKTIDSNSDNMKNLMSLLLALALAGIFGISFANDAAAYNSKTTVVKQDYQLIYRWNTQCNTTTRLFLLVDQCIKRPDACPDPFCFHMNRFGKEKVNVLHRVDMTQGDYTVQIGDPINFAYNPDPPFFHNVGGSLDTPYGAWCSDLSSDCGSQRQLSDVSFLRSLRFFNDDWYDYDIEYLKLAWTAVKPKVAMVSSDPKIVSCSGMNCQAVKEGTAFISAIIDGFPAKQWNYCLDSGKKSVSCKGFFEEDNFMFGFGNDDERTMHEPWGNMTVDFPKSKIERWFVKVIKEGIDFKIYLDARHQSGLTYHITPTFGGSAIGPIEFTDYKCDAAGLIVAQNFNDQTGEFDCTYPNYDTTYNVSLTGKREGLQSTGATSLTTPQSSLAAVLTAHPSSGSAPLMSTLTARAEGTENHPTLNYYFWINCNVSDCGTLAECRSKGCGGPNYTKLNHPEETYSVDVTYSLDDVYYPKVVIERGPRSAVDGAVVSVGLCVPLSGECGSANNATSCQAPSSGYCARGSLVNGSLELKESTRQWQWQCEGVCGGSATSCKADRRCSYIEVAP